MSNRGYSPDCHSVLRAHARVLLYMTNDKKGFQRVGHKYLRTHPPGYALREDPCPPVVLTAGSFFLFNPIANNFLINMNHNCH